MYIGIFAINANTADCGDNGDNDADVDDDD